MTYPTDTPNSSFCIWLEEKRELARQNDESFFMRTPESWFEQFVVGCENGHVSRSVLLTESGHRCLDCYYPTYMIPNDTVESQFQKELKEIENRE